MIYYASFSFWSSQSSSAIFYAITWFVYVLCLISKQFTIIIVGWAAAMHLYNDPTVDLSGEFKTLKKKKKIKISLIYF